MNLEKKPLTYKISLLLIIIFGAITPFIDYFVVIEMFFLLIPFVIILIFSMIIFVINLFRYKYKIFKEKSTHIIIVIPIFLLSQIGSTFIIDKIQKFRSDRIIINLEKNYKSFPEALNISLGIKYQKIKNTNEFKIEFNRGFMVREIYSSQTKNWEIFGWND